MSQELAPTTAAASLAAVSALGPEPTATLATSAAGPSSSTAPAPAVSVPTATPAPAPKPRSCVVCRSRKVRCDKQLPCSNCRRANIPCVTPPSDRPPRWARRLERLGVNTNRDHVTATEATEMPNASMAPIPSLQPTQNGPGVEDIMQRLRNLEGLVKELSGQLEQAQASAAGTVPAGSVDTDGVQKRFGRLVLQDTSQSRYVSSGFWSRVNDELYELEMDTRSLLVSDESDSLEDEIPVVPRKSPSPFTSQNLERSPSERHAFLFRHNLNLSVHDVCEFHPPLSQIPVLLEVFSKNVNFVIQTLHMPTVTKMVRDLPGGDLKHLTPANEALMFSIYYAAIIAMDEDDIMTKFGFSKNELSLKYRLGLEYSLAKADLFNAPDIVLVQAFAVFLCVVRRHDSPRFVWMMTGLVIRMAQYLGLQRDGSNFDHFTPFEIEIRRKVWWAVVNLDMRSSEDQGTDLAIAHGSFDTKIPLNINDEDIDPETKEMPAAREGVTDMSFARMWMGFCELMRQMLGPDIAKGIGGLEDQNRLLNEMYRMYEDGYLQRAADSESKMFSVGITITRLVMAKMSLIVFLPALFSSPSEHFSDEIRTKLLIAAIEVAEFNHVLNSEPAGRHLRWMYQTYTHWHAIVYLMIDIARRPWSAIVERAWVALHSSWLIPPHYSKDKNLRIWFPLRKLMAKAREHRTSELDRLRADPETAKRLDAEDRMIPLPLSPGPLVSTEGGRDANTFRERWSQLVNLRSDGPGDGVLATLEVSVTTEGTEPIVHVPTHARQPTAGPILDGSGGSMSNSVGIGPLYQTNVSASELAPEQTVAPELSSNLPPSFPVNWSDGHPMGTGGFVPWLWGDADPSAGPSVDPLSSHDPDLHTMDVNMDWDSGEMNWYNWIESAEGLDEDANDSWGP